MRRRYQINKERAVHQFGRLAREKNASIQMVLPLTSIIAWLQQGVGHLLRQAGLELMGLVMEEEVRELCGERHQQHAGRQAHRWGKEDGYCVVDGQKVPIQRTRLRSNEKGEVPLGSYEVFRRQPVLSQWVWDKMLLGLSTRNYGQVVKEFTTAYGVEKSATSKHFIAASREKLKGLLERDLSDLRLCAMLIDGTRVQEATLHRGAGDRPGRAENGAGAAAGTDGERHGGERVVERSPATRGRFQPAAAVRAGWEPRAAPGGAAACRRERIHPALPAPQEAERSEASI